MKFKRLDKQSSTVETINSYKHNISTHIEELEKLEKEKKRLSGELDAISTKIKDKKSIIATLKEKVSNLSRG
jgi:predicted  nucleic acid-binding Zn-ribbon protein